MTCGQKRKISLIYNQDNRKYTNISLAGKHIGLIVTNPYGQDIPDSSRIFNIKFKFWQIKIPAFSTGSLTVNAGNQNLNQQTNINTNNSNNNNSNLNSYQPKGIITDIEPNDCDTMEKINPGWAITNKFYTNKVCLDLGKNNITIEGKYGSIRGYSFLAI